MKYTLVRRAESDSGVSKEECLGVYGKYKAIGKTVCTIRDDEQQWLSEGFSIEDSDDFYAVGTSGDGYGWFRQYHNSKTESTVVETYLLMPVQKEKEDSQ